MAELTVAGERIEADRVYRRLHLHQPDYGRPLLEVTQQQRARILDLLASLYGEEEASAWYPELERLMKVYYAHKTSEMVEDDGSFEPSERFTEKDIILITYGDLILSADQPPLKVLDRILDTYAENITTVHILPFFPYSSDRGFAVVDYREVDPHLGSWEDVEHLATRFELMFDGVINHTSSRCRWFREYLNSNPDFTDHYLGYTDRDIPSDEELKMVMRPRSSDLLTRFEAMDGTRWVWTTFGPDQVDLNYHNPKVLMRMLDVLLHYVRRGADLLRLDAVTYLWDEPGTRAVHLEQTHAVIRLLRAILDVVAPRVALVSEANVPYGEYVAYFGDGSDEAQLVYNFALPPLVLHTFQTGNCEALTKWAASTSPPSERATYLNFLDSHDGIGLLGASEMLTESQIRAMIEGAEAHGGLVSYRAGPDGRQAPYEINITWWSAMNREGAPESMDLHVDRYFASRSIQMALRGVPAVYLIGMAGGKNDVETVTETGEARSINRRAIDAAMLEAMLRNPRSHVGRVARRMLDLSSARVHSRAFHPNAEQEVVEKSSAVFTVVRRSSDGAESILALTNVTDQAQTVAFEAPELDIRWSSTWRDQLTGHLVRPEAETLVLRLAPYQVLWLSPLEV